MKKRVMTVAMKWRLTPILARFSALLAMDWTKKKSDLVATQDTLKMVGLIEFDRPFYTNSFAFAWW